MITSLLVGLSSPAPSAEGDPDDVPPVARLLDEREGSMIPTHPRPIPARFSQIRPGAPVVLRDRAKGSSSHRPATGQQHWSASRPPQLGSVPTGQVDSPASGPAGPMPGERGQRPRIPRSPPFVDKAEIVITGGRVPYDSLTERAP